MFSAHEKLKHDGPLPNSASNYNLCRYTLVYFAVICVAVVLRVIRQMVHEYFVRAKALAQSRLAARKRYFHKKIDPEAKSWVGVSDERHGLPLERPELQDVDDMLTEVEEMELELVGTDG